MRQAAYWCEGKRWWPLPDSLSYAYRKQYANTLPSDLWDPAALPAWAYKGPLRRAQEKAQERPRGERVEFVAASDAAPRSRSGTPTVPPVTGKRKSRFDT